MQSTVETAPNEAIHLCWKQSLINSVYLQNLVSTVDQAVTLRCFESTRLPQSVLHASEPSSDFRRNHIADSIKKYLMWLFYSSNNLGWFACFRIQFLPDHIMIHSCLVCVCVCVYVCVYIYISLQGLLAGTDGFLLTSLNHFQDFGSVA